MSGAGGREQWRKTTQQRRGGSSSSVLTAGQAAEEAEPQQDLAKKPPRNPNFNDWEDVTLGRSFANGTCDPILGNNQRGNAFWGKVTELYGVAHQHTDVSVSKNPHTRSLEQLKNRFKIITRELGFFHTHYKHIVQENPSGVPEEEYIALASDRFKEVEGRKFKFQKVFPILQDVVKYSGGVEEEASLPEGFLDHHHHYQPSVATTVDSIREDCSVETLLTPRDAVVTPVNPSRVNMAGSVMGSRMRRPMGTKRAKALAASRGEAPPAELPMIIAEAPPPPRSAATVVADKLTTHLGKIFRNGHKKDQFDIRYKCWKALVHHQEELEARSVMQEMMTYREPLTENQGEVVDLHEEEEEEEEVEVVGVATTTQAGEGSASPDSLARRIARQSRQQQEAHEEFEEGSVNLLEETQEDEGREDKAAEEEVKEDDETDDDESTLSPPPLKPVREPILPLYTHKAPFDKPLRSSRPRRDQVVVTNCKKQKKNTASLDIDDINTQALMDFNTQALMEARSTHTDESLPPPPQTNRRSEGGL
jgi:hypothetical protein